MAGFFKVPAELIPLVVDGSGKTVIKKGKAIEDLANLKYLIVILFEGSRARIIGKCEADDLMASGNAYQEKCGMLEIRSNKGKLKLKAIRRTKLTSARGLSSRMSPSHPQSSGDFRRGAYHDLLDGANPVASLSWGDQNRHHNGPALCYYFETCRGISDREQNGMRLCRACAEKTEIDPELIQVLRDLDEEPLHASAS
jgi:hypothetical protein